MSIIKIYTPSGEKIYFHDVVSVEHEHFGVRGFETDKIILKQDSNGFTSETVIMKQNIICVQSFDDDIGALYFEPAPTEKEEKPKDNNNWQAYSIISLIVSVVCLMAVILIALS